MPTETCIILSPNENEPKYADSAVVLEEYGERSPPSRPNADCKPRQPEPKMRNTWVMSTDAVVGDQKILKGR